MAHIQSLDRAIDIVELLEWYAGGVGLSQIAERVGLNASTAHHLLVTLRERGYVEQDPVTRRYRLGSRLLNLTSGFVHESNLRAVAFPHLRALSECGRENLRLGVLGDDSVITLIKVDAHSTPFIHTSIEQWRAIHATGLGKVLLAGLSQAERGRYLGRAGLPRLTATTITDPAEFEAEMARIVARGYGFDDGEMDEGLRCVAAPVRDRAGATVAAVSVAVPAYRYTPALAEFLIEVVPQTADRISQGLARHDPPELAPRPSGCRGPGDLALAGNGSVDTGGGDRPMSPGPPIDRATRGGGESILLSSSSYRSAI